MDEHSAACVPSSISTTLIEGIRSQEPEAWKRLVRLYGPLIYHWGRSCGLQDHDAADVMQEVLRSVNQGIARFDHRQKNSSFRGWLWTITRNRIRDCLSEQNSRLRPLGGTDAYRHLQSLPQEPPGSPEDSRLSRSALEQIREEFAPHLWTAFWRTAIERDAVRDVAEDLGLSIWAVYKARARILRRLRDELGEWTEPTEDSQQNGDSHKPWRP